MTAIWAGLVGLLLVLVAVDLAFIDRRRGWRGPRAGVGRALFYFVVASGFASVVYFLYEHRHATAEEAGLTGKEAFFQFLTLLSIELALGLDSVFVFAAIFLHMKTPIRFRHRLLMYGVPLALLIRAAIIAAGAWAISLTPVARFGFCALLLLAALRMILIRQENTDPEKNFAVRLLRRWLPMAGRTKGFELLTNVGGRPALTIMLAALLLVETADGFLAFDSIPASFSISREPLLIFAATAFAALILRSLYSVLVWWTGWLRYVKIGLAMILVYAAVKVAMPRSPDEGLPAAVSLMVVLVAFLTGVLAAVRAGRELAIGQRAETSALGEEADRLARLTLKQARRLIILVVGITIVTLGIVMLIGPGPGMLVIPVGLALLASEFLWAKRLLTRFTDQALKVTQRATKTPRLWMIPVVFAISGAIFGGAWWLVSRYGPFELPGMKITPRFVFLSAIPPHVGQIVWAVLTVMKWRELRRARGTTVGTHPAQQSDQSTGPV